MCPRGEMKRPAGVMSMNLFKKIIDEVKNYNIKKIILQGFGEPLLDTTFIEKIKYAKSKLPVLIEFNTNGSILNEKKIIQLIDSGVDRINFSLYATNPETYKRIHQTDNFEKVKNNIIRFSEIKKARGREKPLLFMGFLKPAGSNETYEEWSKFWGRYVDRTEHEEGRVHNFACEKGYKGNKNIARMTCGKPFSTVHIYWNGDVGLCCVEFRARMIFGNVKKDSLKSIVESDKYQAMIKMHGGDFLKPRVPVCDNCELLVPASLRNKIARWIFLHVKRKYFGE